MPPRQPSAQQSALFIAGLGKGLTLLSAFSAERRSMSLGELTATTGFSRSSVQRLVFTLEGLGYLRRGPDGAGYEPTPRICELGFRYLVTSRLVSASNSHLFDLNKRCGETVNLSEPDGTDMVFVARFPGRNSIDIHMPIGHRLPMYCTASGRAWLSQAPLVTVREVLRASERRAFTATTVTDLAGLERLVAEARVHGYAWANGEYYRGDINVAAPLVRAGGTAVGAINISTPATRWTIERARDELAPLAIETARAISSTLI